MAVAGVRASHLFALVVLAHELVLAVVDALALDGNAAVGFDPFAGVVSRADFVFVAVPAVHARDRLAGQISAAAFAILAILLWIFKTVVVLFAIRVHALVVFA